MKQYNSPIEQTKLSLNKYAIFLAAFNNSVRRSTILKPEPSCASNFFFFWSCASIRWSSSKKKRKRQINVRNYNVASNAISKANVPSWTYEKKSRSKQMLYCTSANRTSVTVSFGILFLCLSLAMLPATTSLLRW